MHGSRLPILAVLLAALLLCTAAGDPGSLRLEVKTSPNAAYAASSAVRSVSLAKLLADAHTEQAADAPALTDAYLVAPDGVYRLDASGSLWDERRSLRVRLPRAAAKKLKLQAAALRLQHYGELTDWAEASRLLPRKSTFAITDAETGLTFRVQRRAGSDHADVQPLTKEDTRIMRQIYGEGWSWRRKAIFVTAGGKRLAASMNGMPHGGDGIPGNDFSGHFCVHFLNSSTHRSETPDLIHQLMVHKAAGTLRAHLDDSSPFTLADQLIVAMDHRDGELLRMMSEGMELTRSQTLQEEARTLSSIRRADKPKAELEPDVSRLLVCEVERSIAMTFVRGGKRNGTLRLAFSRSAADAPWRLAEISPLTDKKRSDLP